MKTHLYPGIGVFLQGRIQYCWVNYGGDICGSVFGKKEEETLPVSGGKSVIMGRLITKWKK